MVLCRFYPLNVSFVLSFLEIRKGNLHNEMAALVVSSASALVAIALNGRIPEISEFKTIAYSYLL